MIFLEKKDETFTGCFVFFETISNQFHFRRYLFSNLRYRLVKLRGYAKNPLLDPHFFIVMDRLYEILNHRILEWKTELQKNSTSIWQALLPHRRRMNNDTIDKKQERERVVHDVMVQRLIVSYDLASAFAYMHENR